MRIDPKAIGVAAGITAALITALCAAFVAVAPATAIAFLGLVIHMDLAGMASRVTWPAFFTGLLFWSLFAGLIFGFAAWLYDRLIRETDGGGTVVAPSEHG
jgi:hypothetical protein